MGLHSVGDVYSNNVLLPQVRNVAVRHIVKALKNHQFDVIAVSGYSATTMGSIIAGRMNKRLVVVRKARETSETGHSHASKIVSGFIDKNDKAVIIDDLIATGQTLNYIKSQLLKHNITTIGFVTYQNYASSNEYLNQLMSAVEQDEMFDALSNKKRNLRKAGKI